MKKQIFQKYPMKIHVDSHMVMSKIKTSFPHTVVKKNFFGGHTHTECSERGFPHFMMTDFKTSHGSIRSSTNLNGDFFFQEIGAQ